ncbi:MAG: histidine kinase [Lachnospiraceae bacterium]|nr:histidine kinase [Lachnospiraceae bacterium]
MRKASLRKRLIVLFALTSVLPILLLGLFSYYNIHKGLRENTEIMTKNNLAQVDNNLNIFIESYEDILYQIYTEDNMVIWTDNLSKEKDEAVTINQMRRFLSSLLYTKDYIRAITVITPAGNVITYEQMTPATYKSSWLPKFSISEDELYENVIQDYNTHIFSTEYGTNFANKDYYLFHIAHRIIDYHNLNKECGIAIISIDSDFLKNVCVNTAKESSAFNFIVDEKGRVISFGEDDGMIGKNISDMGKNENARLSDYLHFLKNDAGLSVQKEGVFLYHDEGLSWDIVNLADLNSLLLSQRRQMIIVLLLGLIIMAVVIFISTVMSQDLILSVKKVLGGMKKAEGGDLSVRIEGMESMPPEIADIAEGFNGTLEKLNEAVVSQREAEIMAMEAQINPHFLYNTLDTINWMAIDKDEYDISNAISALANILRYAIVNSNAEVFVEEEIEWLKNYIFLQQYRLKNKFSYNIDVTPDIKKAAIHKLLLQPFIENAIIHGLKNVDDALLSVAISKEGDKLKIAIEDNGSGIDSEVLSKINSGTYKKEGKSNGIGMNNAITRLEMYYGKRAQITISSVKTGGTRVEIKIPYSEKEV